MHGLMLRILFWGSLAAGIVVFALLMGLAAIGFLALLAGS